MMQSFIDFTKSKLVTDAELVHLAARPLPAAPDGRYDYEALAAGEVSSSGASGGSDAHSRLYSLVARAQEAVGKGPLITDPKMPVATLDYLINDDAVDDRKGLFLSGLSMVSRLPPGKLQDTLNDEANAMLYNTLPHPPDTLLGPEHQFRAADGSRNNPLLPDLGKAGTRYARSVNGKHPSPPNALPDPGLVFDMLLKARDFQAHPGGLNSIAFAYASLVTHSIFRTDLSDWTKNNTSSYLDLSPLYGCDQVMQDQVRDKEKGRGLLYPDTFSEDRLGFVPPAASALLVVFSRNHNYIADMLLRINERKRWTDPPPTDPKARAQQDEEIFQTARLVNCGHFMALIFGDYVSTFLGLNRDGSTWTINPFNPITTKKGEVVERGRGNQCSVEFSILYRWHATTAKEDITWTEENFNRLFKGKALSEITLQDFKTAAIEAFRTQEPDPKKRTFGGIKRQENGTFSDDDLAGVLHDATEKAGGAYRARGTPAALRVIEIMGILQARAWGCCTMNEFRKFLGLKQFSTFEEWSSVPEVANAARQLYGHIDNLELYAGLQAEDCWKVGPGSALCCGYTTLRAILGDAVALVRGDRFYTIDYTPHNLTAWGFQDCVRDPNNGAYGAALPKLLMRHLPRHYPADSVYSLFPFFTPTSAKANVAKLGLADKYKYDRPRPTPIPKVLSTLTGIRYVFNDSIKFPGPYEEDMKMISGGYGFILCFDDPKQHDADKAICYRALLPDKAAYNKLVGWFKTTMYKALKERSVRYDGVPGMFVDIVRDVINIVAVHWVADQLCGIPLKTKENPRGLFTEQEVFDMFELFFTCIFLNVTPEHKWSLRAAGKQFSEIVNNLIAKALADAAPYTAPTLLGKIHETVKDVVHADKKECTGFLSRLAASGRPANQLVAFVSGFAIGSCANYAQAATHVIDFYLDDARSKERTHIIELSKRPDNDAKARELLMGYVKEAMRLHPQFIGLFRVAAVDDTIPQGSGFEPLKVKKGDLLFAGYKNAHRNPQDFPNPEVIDPTRPKNSYAIQGIGMHICPGVELTPDTITDILKLVFSLPNVRRAPSPGGDCTGFNIRVFDTDNKLYLSSTGNTTPWPSTLQVVYDA